jgi:hypothetical protein
MREACYGFQVAAYNPENYSERLQSPSKLFRSPGIDSKEFIQIDFASRCSLAGLYSTTTLQYF